MYRQRVSFCYTSFFSFSFCPLFCFNTYIHTYSSTIYIYINTPYDEGKKEINEEKKRGERERQEEKKRDCLSKNNRLDSRIHAFATVQLTDVFFFVYI